MKKAPTGQPAGALGLPAMISEDSASESISRHPHPAFHQDTCAATHDRLGDLSLTVHLTRFGTNPQGAGWMAEAHGLTIAAASGLIDQGARDRRRRPYRHRRSAHHRVVQLAHGQRPYQQIHLTRLDLLAAGGPIVLGPRDEGDLRRMLALGSLLRLA